MSKVIFSIIVPAYNEEAVIIESHNRLKAVMDVFNDSYEIIFINDGSRDKTAELLRTICNTDKKSKMISFSRNFGHQTAISAGMKYASGDAMIIIDADLQDPPEIIPEMIAKWREGYQVVYGKRIQRKGETLFKKVTANIFYRFLNLLTDVNIPVDSGDFRLIDRKVCDVLNSLPERNRYVRGLVSWAGFRQTSLEYVRMERFAGETKYPLRKMLHFAADGITSFSHKPLTLSIMIGCSLSFFSFIYMIVVIFEKFFTDKAISGWASTMTVMLFFNGVTLIMLGIIGGYIGRIYDEAKARPLYVIGETAGFENDRN